MRPLSLLGNSPRVSGPAVRLVAILSLALITFTWLLHGRTGSSFGELTRDPSAVYDFEAHIGFLSQVGVMFWAAAVAVCWFSARLLEGIPEKRELCRFLILSEGMTLLLGLDDAFLLHEKLLPTFGIPESALFAAYLVLVGLLFGRHAELIRKTEWILLVLALGFFTLSMGLNLVQIYYVDPYLYEDSAKLIGILSWLAYFVRLGVQSGRDPSY